MKRRRLFTLFITGSLALTAAAGEPRAPSEHVLGKGRDLATSSPAPDFAPVARLIEEKVVAGKFPSIAVAVAYRGKVLWEYAFGLADKEKLVPATPHTMYHLASVTKTFTGAGIMELRERGRIDLDKPVNDFLGEAKLWSPKWDPRGATVRRVATHLGGLATYDQACFPDEPGCETSFDVMLRHYGVVIWKPGAHFDYSNLGYGVLSAAIAHIAGKSYANFLQDDLFTPLGMTECTVDPKPGIARPYDEHGAATLPHTSVAQGASSASCSADSLLKFAMFNLKDHVPGQRPILSDVAIDAMHNQTVPTGDAGQSYGLGWWVNENQHGYRVVYDGGGTIDSKALLYTVPTEDIAVVVLSNGPALEADQIVDRVFAALLPRYAHDLTASASPTAIAVSTPTPTSSEEDGWRIGTWKGEISTYAGRRALTITVEGPGKGSVQLESQDAVRAERLRYLNNGFVVRAVADLNTPDANQHKPYVLGFELYRDGDDAYGSVTTWSQHGARDGGLFSYFVRLHKMAIQ